MQNVKFRCVLALSGADAKKSNHSKFYSIHNGSIYGALRTRNT